MGDASAVREQQRAVSESVTTQSSSAAHQAGGGCDGCDGSSWVLYGGGVDGVSQPAAGSIDLARGTPVSDAASDESTDEAEAKSEE